jgi:hypothetical protein
MFSSTSRPSRVRATENWQKANASSSNRSRVRRARRRSRCVLPRGADDQERGNVEERKDPPSARAPAGAARDSDEEALSLRDSGQTYVAVARRLGLGRALDAQAAFLRALRQHDGEDRDRLIQRETTRLDELETRIRSRDATEPEMMERRLLALAKLREKLA